jgi:hypothetical protein
MAIYRWTIAVDGNDHGFSESLYFQRSSEDIDAAVAITTPIIPKRAALLGAECNIKASRVQLVLNNAGLKTLRRGDLQKGYWPGTLSQPACESTIRLQVLMENSTKTNRKLTFMGGVWRSIFPAADSFDGNQGGFLSLFNSWKSSIIAAGMGWMAVPNDPPKSNIVGYVFDPDTGHTTYTLANGGIAFPELNVPYRVNVEFPLQRSPLDGVQLVIPLTATTCITAKPRPASPFVVVGKMTLLGSQFINLATTNNAGNPGTVSPQNPMGHKAGRPLYTSRGRLPLTVRW